jgi:flagellar basal-body rod modification protein FlgD
MISPDDFMQLLIAQLQNQDPTNPMDPSAMVSQLATMDMVSETRATRQGQDMLQAINMMGKTVSWTDPTSGATQSGQVSGIVQDSSEDVELTVGSQQLKLSDIVAIS